MFVTSTTRERSPKLDYRCRIYNLRFAANGIIITNNYIVCYPDMQANPWMVPGPVNRDPPSNRTYIARPILG